MHFARGVNGFCHLLCLLWCLEPWPQALLTHSPPTGPSWPPPILKCLLPDLCLSSSDPHRWPAQAYCWSGPTGPGPASRGRCVSAYLLISCVSLLPLKLSRKCFMAFSWQSSVSARTCAGPECFWIASMVTYLCDKKYMIACLTYSKLYMKAPRIVILMFNDELHALLSLGCFLIKLMDHWKKPPGMQSTNIVGRVFMRDWLVWLVW